MTLPEQRWPAPPAALALGADEIHIWRARLDESASAFEECQRSLSTDERQRAGRFHWERDSRRFVVGRGVLRRILGRYLDLDAGQVQFRYGERGKPALAAQPADAHLEFSLAHSGPLALYAFSVQRAIGLDVEQVRPLPDADQLAATFFSASEYAAYRALSPAEKTLGFFLCWTRKEAYVKALGEGLTRPLDAFDVSLKPGAPAHLLRVAWDPDAPTRWSLISLTPWPDVVAALAADGHDWQVACWDYASVPARPSPG